MREVGAGAGIAYFAGNGDSTKAAGIGSGDGTGRVTVAAVIAAVYIARTDRWIGGALLREEQRMRGVHAVAGMEHGDAGGTVLL